jgi:hypothetical protein
MTRALFIGIDYKKPSRWFSCFRDPSPLELKHGVRDSRIALKTMLDRIPNLDYRHLHDDDRDFLPTKQNILSSFNWLCNGSPTAFLHISGHGVYSNGMRPQTEEESQSRSRGLLTYDKKLITHREFIKYLLHRIPKGMTIYCVFDFCYSGNIMKLRHSMEADVSQHHNRSYGNVIAISSSTHLQTSRDEYSVSSVIYRIIQQSGLMTWQEFYEYINEIYSKTQSIEIHSSRRINKDNVFMAGIVD